VKVEKSSGDGVREEKKFAHSTMNLNPGHQLAAILTDSGVPRGGGEFGGFKRPPSHEILNALQNRSKLNPIVKNVKIY